MGIGNKSSKGLAAGLAVSLGGGGGGGTTDYNSLSNKPKLNGVELINNKTNTDLGISKVYDIVNTTTLKDYTIPDLTAEDITNIYNDFILGKMICIKDTNDIYYSINQVNNTDTDKIVVSFTYLNKMIVSFTLDTTTDTITKEGTEFGSKEAQFTSLERLGSYLYRVTFDKIPELDETTTSPIIKGCSSFIREDKMYRNLDFFYDNTAEFLVITKDIEGVAFINGMEDGELDYKKVGQTPYHINDGRNNNTGIMVSSHILYNDFNNYDGSGDKDEDITLIPYFVLTNVNTISELESKLTDFLSNLKIPTALSTLHYLMQYMVSDGTTTKVITPKTDGSGYEIVDISALPKLANFKWINKATITNRNDSDLQARPNGIERWNLIEEGKTLEELRFTKCYEEPTRLSEFIGESGTDKTATDAELESLYNTAHTKYLNRTRDKQTWQTVHSVVYGSKGIEHLWTQENYEKDYIASSEEMKIEEIDIGSNQYIYDNYPLPAISKTNLEKIYDNIVNKKPQHLKWSILGTTTYLSVVSADKIASNYSIDVLVHNKYHCSYTWQDGTTGNVNPEVLKGDIETFIFKGYVSPTAPSNAKKDELWYNSSSEAMPTTFPIAVKRYDGSSWSTTTENYTPSSLEMWANINNSKGYYWFGNEWNLIDADAEVDNITIDKNTAGQIEIKEILTAEDNNDITLATDSISFWKLLWKKTGQIKEKIAGNVITFAKGITMTASGEVGHTNSITAGNTGATVGANSYKPKKATYDAQGHITDVADDIALTFQNGIKSNAAGVVEHTNAITAKTTEALMKVKYDAQGHITGSTDVNVLTSMLKADTDNDLYSAKNIFYQLTNRQFNIHIGGSPANVFSRDGWLKYIENNFSEFHKYNEIFTATGQFTTGEAPESGLFFFMEISRRADMGMIRATNPNTGHIFVSYTTDGTTWSVWEPMLKGNLATSISSASTDAEVPSAKAVWTEAEKRVRDLGSIGTGKTRDDLVSVISKNNNESYIGWCKFTTAESPTGDTASYTLLVNCPIKANPYITIQATNCNTGEIFITKNTGSGWLDWKFVPVFDTKIYADFTRNAVANMLTHNGEISFLGRFTTGEHPQSGFILKITVNLMIDTTSGIKYYSIKTYRYSTNQTWVTIANGTGTTFTWSDWVNETISDKLNISEVLTGTKTRAQIFTATGNQSTKIFSTVYFASTDVPPGATTGTSFTVIAGTNSSGTYGTIQALHQGNGDFFVCSCNSGTFSAWKKIATDIEPIDITSQFTFTGIDSSTAGLVKVIKTGKTICITLKGAKFTSAGTNTFCQVPTAYTPIVQYDSTVVTYSDYSIRLLQIQTTRNIALYGVEVGKPYYGQLRWEIV